MALVDTLRALEEFSRRDLQVAEGECRWGESPPEFELRLLLLATNTSPALAQEVLEAASHHHAGAEGREVTMDMLGGFLMGFLLAKYLWDRKEVSTLH